MIQEPAWGYQIAYTPDDAWKVIGLKSRVLLNAAVARGDISPAYFGRKTPVFKHVDLVALVESLPLDRPDN